ncbi:DedA family protein [Methanolobus sediminis]|uniref:DedA family protein n=1 Tax=Methanolobus sediminis TaxID=3072978 RepID=A0AA51YIC2_9EURY|nr:DedA family protein [Methanolobus sediminis]WMW24371.1 DedA family protein [Methanolobus sediminis]
MSNWEFLVPYLEHLSYVGIFITLAFLGHFIPLPEEVLLLIVGYIVSLGFGTLWIVIIVSMIAGAFGDIVLYWLSKNGNKVLSHFDHNKDKKKIARYDRLMNDHGGKTIFTFRLIVGLRFFGPVVAGSANVSWRKFVFYDMLALATFYPILITAGYIFHSNLQNLITDVSILSHVIFFAVVGLFAIVLSIYYKKNFSH